MLKILFKAWRGSQESSIAWLQDLHAKRTVSFQVNRHNTSKHEHIQQHSSQTRLNHLESCSLTSYKELATEAMHVAGLAYCFTWAAHVCPQSETNLPAPVVVTEVCRNLQAPLGTEVGMQKHDITCTCTFSTDATHQYTLHQLVLSEQCNKNNAGNRSTTLPSCLGKREGV